MHQLSSLHRKAQSSCRDRSSKSPQITTILEKEIFSEKSFCTRFARGVRNCEQQHQMSLPQQDLPIVRRIR
jgi:hypothetical protein